MAKSASNLVTELVNMGLFATEPAAITAWANAWRMYFAGAESNSVPITPAILATAESAMASAMGGLSTTGAAAIQAGIIAWWGALAPPPSVFSGASALVPPVGLATIATDFLIAAPVNVSTSASASVAFGNIVNGGVGNVGLFSLDLTGATATFPGPTVAPIL